jgi:hypothetical protein
MMESSLYLPLRTGSREIRILIVLPSLRKSSKLKCELIHVDLDALDEAPFRFYEAASYTWGDFSITRPIKVNGMTFEITSNLDSLLRHLRAKRTKGYYWVDAICINQADITERNQQVQLMKAIYEKAEQVLVWLGLTGNDSDIAMDLIDKITDAEDSEDAKTFPGKPPDWVRLSLENPNDAPKWLALAHLFVRPWWKRVWVRQEVAVASHVMVLCGERLHNWPTLVNAVELMDRYGALFEPFTLQIGSNTSGYHDAIFMDTFREKIRDGSTIEEEVLFFHGRGCEATDPRDRIFALVGLADEDVRRKFMPDYSLPVQEVFQSATMHLVTHKKSLDPLSACQNPLRTGAVPSWVIDFSTDWDSLVLRNHEGSNEIYQASGQSDADVQFTKEGDDHIMKVKGTCVGTISSIGNILAEVEDDEHLQNGEAQQWHDFFLSWIQLVIDVSPDTELKDLIQTWYRTMMADQDGEGNRASTEYMQTWFPYDGHPPKVVEEIDLSAMEHLANRYYESTPLMSTFAFNRHFFTTETGSLGIGSRALRRKDLVCVLLGTGVPFVLRQIGADRFVLVGEAYVHGIMDGEVMRSEEQHQWRNFYIV